MPNACNFGILLQSLANVTSLTFQAVSSSGNQGWNGKGHGQVIVEQVDSSVMLFHERGQWTNKAGKNIDFTNAYRWTLLSYEDTIQLEHLRFGFEHPVYLFDLQQINETCWESISPHVCDKDLYTATMSVLDDRIDLLWIIKGPEKNESICYEYR